MPAAATLISTSSAPIDGTGRLPGFSTSGPPKPSSTMQFISAGRVIAVLRFADH
jgi:hypothetical protein